MQEKLPGRPVGPIAEAVLELLKEKGGLTAREIAVMLMMPIERAKYTCSRLESRGLIRVAKRNRVPGVNKPVAQYKVVHRPQVSPTARLSYPF